jgi:hypothetical protein
MRNRKLNVLLLLLSLIAITSCSSINVTSDYDKSTDFTKFKTYSYYGWAKESDKILNQFDKERIEKAMQDEFTKRGMTYVESGGDLIVTLYIVTQEKQQTTATTTGMGGGYGGYYGYGPGYRWGGGMATTTYNTYDYTVGTLVIDIYNAAKKELIFESVGKGTIQDNPQKREKNIPIVAAEMMKPYPIKPIASK